jgi:hypothetical protein
LPTIYADPLRNRGAPESDLAQLTAALASTGTNGIDFLTLDDRSYSAADQFELLANAVAQLFQAKKPTFPIMAKGLLGPDGLPPQVNQPMHLDWPAFRMAAVDVANFVQTQGRVPARVFIGPDPIPPSVFLIGLARVYDFYLKNGSLPVEAGVDLPATIEILSAHRVAEDTPGLFGGWIIHQENFRAPKVLEVARLQTWTLKPAVRRK